MLPYEHIQFPDYFSRIPLTGDYANLTAKQAKDYFMWFQDIMPKRIDYMLARCSQEMCVPVEQLTCFPNGFLEVWKWFRMRQTMRASTPEEMSQMESQFGFLGESWVPTRILDEATECLHFDIGMFFGDQFIRHYPNDLSWSFYLKPKNDMFVKAPVILGFSKYRNKKGEISSNPAEPVHLVGSRSRLIFQDKMADDSLLLLARQLMQTVYDVDTKEVISPLNL